MKHCSLGCSSFTLCWLLQLPLSYAFSPMPTTNGLFRHDSTSSLHYVTEELAGATTTTTTTTTKMKRPFLKQQQKATTTGKTKSQGDDRTYWKIGPTSHNPHSQPLTPELRHAMETNSHPPHELPQSELGRGVYITADWRQTWYSYQSPSSDPNLVNSETGEANYDLDEIEGVVPDDLVGVLYRNGAGKFGVGEERVAHVLDADGLVSQIRIGPPVADGQKRQLTFLSKFVHTKGFVKEMETKEFATRGVFGTTPRGLASIFPSPKKGVNSDPSQPSLLSRMAGGAFQTEIKNTANTHVVSFGGKLLALFQAGLPYSLNPETLDTIGEDQLGGVLPKGDGLAAKISNNIIPHESMQPSFLGGAANTCHPKMCPRTEHLVSWSWSMLVDKGSLEIKVTEFEEDGFSPVASKTFEMPDCAVAPHDMALTENSVVLLANAMSLDLPNYVLGAKGPAASMKMDGHANVYAHVFPRPTAKHQFEPFVVEVPPNFSIHFSHAYEDEETGNIVTYFSGWPPSDSKDFLGAWGGFAPSFDVIPPTQLYRLEIDPQTKKCVDLSVTRGAENVVAEHVVVHPQFATKKAANIYGVASNVVGHASAPCGYFCHNVWDEEPQKLEVGEYNKKVDAYWFGTRFFVDEPLVVPKRGGDPTDERDAYLIGLVYDAAQHRSFLAIFDLQHNLRDGPVCKVWLRTAIPHGLHGCFAEDGPGTSSVFC